jgi:uncharacterized OB-fold protein
MMDTLNTKPNDEPCACSTYHGYLLNAGKHRSSLVDITCKKCGKTFQSNVQKEYCIDCESTTK